MGIKSFTLIFTALCLVLNTVPSFAAAPTMYVLKEKHHHIGNLRIYMTHDAIKVVSDTNGYELISQAPKWDVLMYRPDSKEGYTTTVDEMSKKSIWPMGQFAERDTSPLVKDGEEKIHGRKTTVYKEDRGNRFSKFWVWEDGPFTPQISAFLRAFFEFYTLSGKKGVLLRCTTSMKKGAPKTRLSNMSMMPGGDVVWLDTLELKEAPYSPSIFTVPKGIKKVKSSQEILISRNQQHDLEDALNDLGVGTKIGK